MNDIYLPQPKIARQHHFAPIWLLPIIALLVGIWLVWRSLLDIGPQISIEFESGEGIVPNQTQVQYKGIVIGVVKDLKAKEDYSGVLATIQIDKRVEERFGGVPEETEFWLVQPQVSLAGVSGLNTLFSGNYIGLNLPSKELSGRTKSHFVALKSPPPLPNFVPGLHISFRTDRVGSVAVGTPVYSRQMQIGSVKTVTLLPDGSGVEIRAHILPEYEHLVRKNTRFWNASGVRLEAGLGGVRLETESVLSLLAGGISMSLPDEQSAPAGDGDHFYLYEDFEAAEASVFANVQFPSADGLTKGVTKVLYKGITVGKLRDLWYDSSRDAVIGRFGIDPRFESFITDKTRFWLVKPELTAAGVSGLDALVSGAYLAFTPDMKGEPVRDHHFVATDGPDPLDFSEPGLHLRLTTPLAGSFNPGTPVYYREFIVGSVQSRVLEKDGAAIHVLVKPAYRHLVNRSSRFWSVSGVRLEASLANGLEVQVPPLAGLLAGGIAFDTPDSKASTDVHDGHEFRLFDNEKAATAPVPGSLPGLYLTLEAPDAGGLQAGAPVLFRELPVGSVQELRHSEDGQRVQLKVHIEATHARLLDSSVRFWRASAVEMKLGAGGATVRAGSALQLLSGGVAFDRFADNRDPKPAAVRAGDRFRLFASRDEAGNAGATIRLQLADAKGLATGSEIRYRGLPLGEITRLQLRDDLKGVTGEAALKTEALPLLTSGTRLWKVEPALGLARTANLDTLLGSYLALEPGTGAASREFSVMHGEPVTTARDSGLNLQLTASALGSLKPGDPVLYRQVKVGEVLGGDLANDGQQVHVYLNIWPQYAGLVKSNSRFWQASGLEVQAGLFSGVNVRSESVETLLAGGIAFSTPDNGGSPASEGQQFTLHDKP